MTIHIGATPDQIADTVLLPGDPYRAKWAAETFLSDVTLVNEVRGMLGFTGFYKDHRVTIQGSGMGMPSLSIYANELIKDYGAKTLIRIGSCGGMQPHVGIRDIILAMTASSISTPSLGIFKEFNFAPCADYALLEAAARAAQAKAIATHIGGIYSSDVFYDERPDLNQEMPPPGLFGCRNGSGRIVQSRRATWRAGAGRFDRFRSFANRRRAARGSARKKFWRYGGNRATCSF
jgi:purine-nucleoside phosphorylase